MKYKKPESACWASETRWFPPGMLSSVALGRKNVAGTNPCPSFAEHTRVPRLQRNALHIAVVPQHDDDACAQLLHVVLRKGKSLQPRTRPAVAAADEASRYQDTRIKIVRIQIGLLELEEVSDGDVGTGRHAAKGLGQPLKGLGS